MLFIYHNALVLSTQGAQRALRPESAKVVFDSNNRIVNNLMKRIQEVRELRQRQLAIMDSDRGSTGEVEAVLRTSVVIQDEPIEHTSYITCFVAIPFSEEYEPVIGALRDVLQGSPYFWRVERADKRYFENEVSRNVAQWIRRAQCFAADLTDGNDNVMMEVGHMYWGYPRRPLILLQRQGVDRSPIDLASRIKIFYPWGEPLGAGEITNKLREEIARFDELTSLKGNAHYLSVQALRAEFIIPRVAEALTQKFETVEDLVTASAADVAHEIGVALAPEGVIRSIQDHLRLTCGL
jgi:hypothetical protein